ncbi:hypothetical protein ACN4EG_23610 [Alkalinema pantanalense CENA528]
MGFVVLCQLTQGSQPSMTFLFVGSSVCRRLPPDPSSRRCPCLKLVVSSLGLHAVIWTLVPPQGTFTPSDHAHAGRTQIVAAADERLSSGYQQLLAAAELNRSTALDEVKAVCTIAGLQSRVVGK